MGHLIENIVEGHSVCQQLLPTEFLLSYWTSYRNNNSWWTSLKTFMMNKWGCQKKTKFLQLGSKIVTLIDGHYSIVLPLKNQNLKMPDNCATAEQGVLSLKKSF